MVTKTLNETFGYDGWCLEVKNTTREEPIKDEQGRYHISYIATARITHIRSGAYRGKTFDSMVIHVFACTAIRQINCKSHALDSTQEDCGAGDAIDRSLATASGNALKGAVTDAMKRAARHFGEKLGNSLYHDGFNANNAPPTLKEALDMLDIDRANSRFGFEKNLSVPISVNSAQSSTLETKIAPPNHTNTTSSCAKFSSALVEQKPRTQYVGNVVMEHLNNKSEQPDLKLSHDPSHHGACDITTQPLNAAPATTRVTPCSRTMTAPTNTSSAVDLSMLDLRRTANMGTSSGKENENPLNKPVEAGLFLPARPGTSRGAPESPTSANIANYSEINGAIPSMFSAHGTMSQALVFEQSRSSTIAQSLKRKSESMQTSSSGLDAKWAKNPYNC